MVALFPQLSNMLSFAFGFATFCPEQDSRNTLLGMESCCLDSEIPNLLLAEGLLQLEALLASHDQTHATQPTLQICLLGGCRLGCHFGRPLGHEFPHLLPEPGIDAAFLIQQPFFAQLGIAPPVF
jgi:hypothetical protein